LKDSKLHIHKLNGVKIAVPISKLCVEDLDYVEGVTGIVINEGRSLSDQINRLFAKDVSPAAISLLDQQTQQQPVQTGQQQPPRRDRRESDGLFRRIRRNM
jgi:hypothetical protein